MRRPINKIEVSMMVVLSMIQAMAFFLPTWVAWFPIAFGNALFFALGQVYEEKAGKEEAKAKEHAYDGGDE